ncbi:kinesin-like protein KIF18A isoform X2 [Paramormyrops kingsleyae]|uniref:Kinesin-like protein n=1 Tax=Paramormyrops kingsleyae TaxID=1676925 RepID=A0A3B3R6P5_9TELE|nr:kinesin-like protein KIF18A [Paramormyrops kingsleyae]XP_023666303.1 kinesin-like protein KIF18A [Paramormyrops kingsleyae]XP_023666309.1 kinesin-like protein KIF18A [Paramormyrops kingsleyae]XP_023666315.1 kinesin-like protein KIF18A [Paramormyrops kingsleyae]XP_023666323.1 kinesin-like protein KIF18A [Paramormyrops kingsleyae]
MAESDVCSHVRVVVRVRPANPRELEGNFKNVVQVVDNHMLIFDPKEEEVTFFHGQKLRNRDVSKRANKDLKFVFDNVFGEDSTQQNIFENSTKGILDGVLNGYNCTVFAYGATGAGKTHTMLGNDSDPGVMYLTMKELFSRIDQVRDEKVFDLAFSYLEVYNEQIRDLLAKSGPLAVREDSAKGVVVQGLTLHQPKSAEHILEALDHGNKNRTQHPTDVNASSSRSHAVFQIYLRQQEKTASLNPNVKVAKMCLIDLAGSERASATNAKGARFREGANINRSLLALGNVINVLADPKSKKTHIPYRDSKLTRLLKDSLGGNCRTIMIANVSPSALSYEDTYNTLKYANRAKEIKSSLKSNVVSLDSHISQYAVICEKQQAEIVMLKQKLKEYEEKYSSVPAASNPVTVQKEAEVKKVAESLQSVFFDRAQIRQDLLYLERQLKENDLRRRHREEVHQQAQLLCAGDKAEKETCKHERRLASLLTHREHIKRRLEEVKQRFQENESRLHRIENDTKLLAKEGQVPWVLQKDRQCHTLQLQVEDLELHIKHATHLISLQDQENSWMQKMMGTLLPAFHRQYSALKASGLNSAENDSDYKAVLQLVLRERGVAWADQPADGACEEPPSNQQELTSLLSFSHLVCRPSTPCGGEKLSRRMSLSQCPALFGKGYAAAEDKENKQSTEQEVHLKKPTRRKLSVSSQPSSSAILAQSLLTPGLQEALSQEGVLPLQYTPKTCTQRNPSIDTVHEDLNATFDLPHSMEPVCNATIILAPGPSNLQTSTDEPSKRSEIPQLLGEKRAKPSYMAMTSAAQRKRKLGFYSITSLREPSKEASHDTVAPKRLKQDPSVASRPLRVPRFRGSEEIGPSRRVLRSISEGNLDLIRAHKSKSSFLKTTLLQKVTKRL